MTFTDGIIVRCPECGTLNVLLNGYDLHTIYKCRHCEGSIIPDDSIVFKQSGRPIP